MSAAFDVALGIMLPEECDPRTGSPHLDPEDPGGFTKWGIAQVEHPDVDVASLSYDDAKAWYAANPWRTIRGDELPLPIAVVLFDAAVNPGEGVAVRLLQAAIGVRLDGVIGPVTLAALGRADPETVLGRLLMERVLYWETRETWALYKREWLERVGRVTAEAARLIGQAR